jgi:hypothetical protein
MFHGNVMLFMTTRIAFMVYLSSLTVMRRLAFGSPASLAEVRASRDELRQDRDEWRGRAETPGEGG